MAGAEYPGPYRKSSDHRAGRILRRETPAILTVSHRGRTMKKIKDKRILVTGAAGFIGAHVVRRLLEDGFEVVGVDNLNNYYDPRLKDARLRKPCMGPRFWFFLLDLADRTRTESLFRHGDFEAVIHLAAQAGVRHSLPSPDEYVASNLVAFVN